MVVFNDLSVREVSFDNTFLNVYFKPKLKLPKAKIHSSQDMRFQGTYFMFTTFGAVGNIVNAVRNDIKIKITQINNNLNDQGHSVILNSDLNLMEKSCQILKNTNNMKCSQFRFKIGLQVGEKFWLLHAEAQTSGGFN